MTPGTLRRPRPASRLTAAVRAPLLLLLVFLATSPGGIAAQAAPSLRVVYGGAPPAAPRAFTPDTSRGAPAYGADALAAVGATVRLTDCGARVLLLGDTLEFESLSPFVDGSVQVQLPAAFYRRGDAAFWPRAFFTDWLPARYPQVTWTDGALRVGGIVATAADAASAKSSAPSARSSAPSARAPERVAAAKPGAPRRLVVLDAGHGGRDPGKIGPGGVREKDVTLSIATRLEGVLKSRGYDVRMTRTADTLIDLADRPRMANDWKNGRPAALFMSIHANAFRGHAEGFETYFLSDARTEDERRVAEMENAAVAYEETPAGGPKTDVGAILNSLRNDYYVHASDDLAESVQRRLARIEPGPNRGVKQAGFRVLVGAFMPAVLVETAFISDRDEERLLATAAFQRRIAQALADSIDDFFDGHQHLWAATGTK